VYTLPITDFDGSSPAASVPQPRLKSPYAEVFPQFSPDGHALAYGSDESGQYEIYVTTYPGPGRRCHVSKEGGIDPSWTPDGQSIGYQSGTAIFEAQVKSVPHCDIGVPRALFKSGYPDRPGFGHDMTRDGRLLLIENKSLFTPSPTLNVLNKFL
jgi:Tol biopolymer transport system component